MNATYRTIWYNMFDFVNLLCIVVTLLIALQLYISIVSDFISSGYWYKMEAADAIYLPMLTINELTLPIVLPDITSLIMLIYCV